MSIITKVLRMYAVYWAPAGIDSFGNPTYATPIEIRVRWDDAQEEFTGEDGTTLISNAVVMVDRDVTTGGVLCPGLLAGLTDATKPFDNDGAYVIRKFNRTPNFRATEFLREATL